MTRFLKMIDRIRSGLWFVPAAMLSTAVALAFGLGALDHSFFRGSDDLPWWVYSGGPEEARGLLATIAGSMITVAGVVFSMTIVALSLASQQFGPRLLRNFMQDRGNQLVLGTFTSLFVYCMLVLRTVRGGELAPFVPHLSLSVAILLSIVAIGVLIYFIHHVSWSIQVDNVIGKLAKDLDRRIDESFGDLDENETPMRTAGDPATVTSLHDGYVQFYALEELVRGAAERKARVRLLRGPGDFAFRDRVLAEVWPPEAVGEGGDWIREAVTIGTVRTELQDVEFDMARLVEIGLRALSPSLNDPFTAISCVNRLGAALARICVLEARWQFRDEENEIRLEVPRIDFVQIANLAIDPMARAARSLPSVQFHQLEVLDRILKGAVPRSRGAILREHGRKIAEMIDRSSLGVFEVRALSELQSRLESGEGDEGERFMSPSMNLSTND
ncbi:MAG TPA: DUF2254 domain-containing protein [Thermoanaerobaculia bacterium]|nr:DUF2254 domain-containing protein [Thermoanaerobaculia bacterium]